MRYMIQKQVPAEIEALILAQARGSYQRDLLNFRHTWSGASLKGEARRWGASYEASRDNLVRRIRRRLRDQGWRGAMTDLVWDLDRKRWVRELILFGPEGGKYVFANGRYADKS